MEKMTKEVIEKKKAVISSAEVMILDTNLPQDTLEYLLTNYSNYNIIDTVSATKAVRISKLLKHINLLKCNRLEAQAITGMPIKNREDIVVAGNTLVDRGAETVIITNGEDGAYLFENNETYRFWSNHTDIENATGAGDAFTALLAYGKVRKLARIDTLIYSMAASRLTLKSDVSELEEINEDLLKIEREEVHYERIH